MAKKIKETKVIDKSNEFDKSGGQFVCKNKCYTLGRLFAVGTKIEVDPGVRVPIVHFDKIAEVAPVKVRKNAVAVEDVE